MTEMRFKGFQIGSNPGTITVTAGAGSDSASVPSFRLPPAQAAFPTISDAFDDGTLTPDDNGITVTTRAWRNADTLASLGSGATLSAAGLGGVQVQYSPDNGTTWSPAIRVYESGMMASHDADDAAVLTIVPHADATHIAVQDGAWNTPATWNTNTVPKYGAVVLVPYGLSVKYDNVTANIRLDRVRVDGRLWVDTANLTSEQLKMLVETIVVTRSGDFEVGTAANRLPSTASFTVTISGKDYSSASYTPTEIKSSRFANARGWERGFIVQGRRSFWGAQKLTWSKANPIDAGATSLTLHKDPTGWAVGDAIVIGGTDCNFVNNSPVWQDEERVITSIVGRVISWTDPLTYPHKNQLSGSTRTDLYPAVIAKGNKNIAVRSEVTSPNWRRGHDVYMHEHTTVDVWDAQFIDLGRTDKSFSAGIIDGNGDYAYIVVGGPNETAPLVNTNNLQSRYPFHLHHIGFNHPENSRPIVRDCYVEGSPGWAVVHHSCDADFQNVAIYKFWGCGMVSEQGNEVGGWIDCIAMHSTVKDDPLIALGPKIGEERHGGGDTFTKGYGFGYRGRAMRTNRCVANSVSWGHAFQHRDGSDPAYMLVYPKPVDRANVDLKEAAALPLAQDYQNGQVWPHIHYPIVHFADNEAIGCISGFHVTKLSPKQFHDINIRLKRFKSWGYLYWGGDLEYVGSYLLDQWDCVAGENGKAQSFGVRLGQNMHQVGLRSPRIEGGQYGFFTVGFSNVSGSAHLTGDPRWYRVGYDVVDTISFSNDETPTPYADVIEDDEDAENERIDYDADPSETYPLVIGTMNASTVYTSTVSNLDGAKGDNLSLNAPLFPKVWDTPLWNNEYFTRLLGYYENQGYYQYNGMDVYVLKDIISDRLTARPAKITKIIEAPVDTVFGDVSMYDKGALNYGANPVAVTDVTAVVAKNGSVVIDVPTASSASGGDGSTYTLDTDDHIAPDHGRVLLDGGTGNLTFTPDVDYTGTDEMFAFVQSGHRFGTVRINFLVTDSGTDGGVTTPVVDTDFAASDGGGQTIDVELFDKPDASGRRIELVQYNTDGGTTWRRLCNGWVKATHNISVESDGTAITAGSYNVRIRYKTDYDFVTSTQSGDDAVTVA